MNAQPSPAPPTHGLLSTALGRFRLVSLAEGLSYILLLGVAMPLKYIAGLPQAVRVLGSLHGALFVLFVLALVAAMRERGWGLTRALWFAFLSTLPLGALRIEVEARRAGG